VLCYHAVSPDWPIGLAVTPAALERQMTLLLRRGYVPATFWEVVHQPPGPRSFAVTFDDGWVSVLQHGFPILNRLGVPGTVFVAAKLVDTHEQPLRGAVIDPWQDTPHRNELYCLSWEELRRLSAEGWEIGAHSMTHPLLTRVDDEALAWEVQESKRRCAEMLEVPCRTMAYPTGDFDDRVERAVAVAGYEAAAALPRRFSNARPLAWPRVSIQRQDSDLAFQVKVSRLVRTLRRSQIWPLLDAIRLGLRASPARHGGTPQS
jgi:peptidoglycan/xylan/chitin deacetylase (PgdA/CDA1 family)